jgi:hypothetical protein
MNNIIKAWCFQNKKTGILEPIEGLDNKNKGTRWYDGYGIWGTRKQLLENVWNEMPNGYRPVRVKLRLLSQKLTK